jgi:hypothetical protein
MQQGSKEGHTVGVSETRGKGSQGQSSVCAVVRGIIKSGLRMSCHFFLSEKVVHTLSFGALQQFESHMEVTYFRLTREQLRSRIQLLT